MAAGHRRLTYRVELPGGQLRLREMILYVSMRCADARRFDKVKLNKILWKSDFDAFAARRVPVTGRAYQRLQWGPAAVEMPPLYGEMLQDGLFHVERIDLGDNFVEQRTIPDAEPELKALQRERSVLRRFGHRALLGEDRARSQRRLAWGGLAVARGWRSYALRISLALRSAPWGSAGCSSARVGKAVRME